MEDEIFDIVTDLLRDDITKDEAVDKLVDLRSGSVFIVCENDDYGRDLYLCTKDTLEEAQKEKGRNVTRHIYKYESNEETEIKESTIRFF
jgi:hypothetical protein